MANDGAPRITTFRPFVVNHSSAKMPLRAFGSYRHGAIIKTDGATDHGFVAALCGSLIIEYSGKLHAGGRRRDAFGDWLISAERERRRLNDEHEISMMRDLGCAAWQIEAVRARIAART